MSSFYCEFKILLLGDQSVEKVAFTKRYCYDIFNPSERLTIGVDFHVKTIEVRGKKIKLQIWDVGGEERFRFLLPTYCLGANGAFILYDITDPQTLDNIGDWTNIIRHKAGDIPIMLVGTNIDLAETQRQITREYGLQVVEKNELASFSEISAKTGQNVNKTFEVLIDLMLRRAEHSDLIKSGIEGKIVKKQFFKKKLIKPSKKPKVEKTKRNQPQYQDRSKFQRDSSSGTPENVDEIASSRSPGLLRPTVAICYFHRKSGPMVFYSYPEGNLDDKLATRIANIMEQTVSEGFFTHSFEQRNLLNYYFEIQSDWARGNRDMLMISIIFNRQINPEIEQNVKILCLEFSEKLRANEDIFTAFYINDINNYEEDDRELIQKNNALIKLWVKELYRATVTGGKSEEDKIALLLRLLDYYGSKDKLPKLLSKRTLDHLNSSLEFLKKYYTTLSHYDILFIEDDLATIRLFTAYFKSQGITWKVATSGTKGLEELENITPKAVLLDIILPDMSGFNICSKIKSNPKMKNIPVFLLGSISRSEIEKNLGEAKADGYILKGFDFSGDNGDDRFPYPYIFKPPKPPDDIEPALQAQRKIPKEKEEPQTEQDCPYCGFKLPKGQKYCPICGKDVF